MDLFLTNPFFIFILLVVCIVGMYLCRQRYLEMKFAEYVVKNQTRKISKDILDEGYNQFKGEELHRYKSLLIRIRATCGHDNIKVGHFAWMMNILDDNSIDVETIEIPLFNEE